VLALAWPIAARALKVGQNVQSVWVKDSNDKPAAIPDVGKKVLTIFYTDPDVKDLNEPFRDMLKAANLDKAKYRGLGVVNMKDTWKPNVFIRRVVRQKEAKFQSLILTDPSHALKKAWDLGDCNDKDIVIVIGKDRKVHLLKTWKMSAEEMKQGLELVKQLMAK
jgi:uncharacterized protein